MNDADDKPVKVPIWFRLALIAVAIAVIAVVVAVFDPHIPFADGWTQNAL